MKKSILYTILLSFILSNQSFAVVPDEDIMKLAKNMSQSFDQNIVDPFVCTVCVTCGASTGQLLNQQFLILTTGVKSTNWSNRYDDDLGFYIGGSIGLWIGKCIVNEKHKAQAKLGDSFWKLLDAGKGAAQGMISYIIQSPTNFLCWGIDYCTFWLNKKKSN